MQYDYGGPYIYATSVEGRVLDVWKWEGSIPRRYKQAVLPKNHFDANWVEGDQIVCNGLAKNRPKFVAIMDGATMAPSQKWDIPSGWWCSLLTVSRNGKYIGAILEEEHADHDHPRLQVGLIGPDRKDVNWFITLVGRGSGEGTALPSDDGAHVAIARYESYKLAMVDVAAKKSLWVTCPTGEASIECVAFSPDGKAVYAGGASAAVFALDVSTGKPISKWFASPTGKEEYGHRMTKIAVSPDGRWVAAGTFPPALVFIGSTANNKLVATLDPGAGISLLQFSPDSKALATVVNEQIKIWNASRWDKSTSAPSTPPPTSQPATPATRPA